MEASLAGRTQRHGYVIGFAYAGTCWDHTRHRQQRLKVSHSLVVSVRKRLGSDKDDTYDSGDLKRRANQSAGVGYTLLRIRLGCIHSFQAHTFTLLASLFLSLVVGVVKSSG
jgi:hypothetical protein